MFHKYLANILTFLKHRITNAVSEGLNSTIQTIEDGLRIPQPRKLQNCDLFSSRRAESLPSYPQKCRMNHKE
jgi:hypothetical protein